MTWRWSLTYQWRFGKWWTPSKFLMANRMKHNFGGNAHLCLGPLALQYSWQKPMWYRDLYRKLRDEQDGLSAPKFAPVMVERPSAGPLH
jgi:hypothetical protein